MSKQQEIDKRTDYLVKTATNSYTTITLSIAPIGSGEWQLRED